MLDKIHDVDYEKLVREKYPDAWCEEVPHIFLGRAFAIMRMRGVWFWQYAIEIGFSTVRSRWAWLDAYYAIEKGSK